MLASRPIEENQTAFTCPLCHGFNRVYQQSRETFAQLELKAESINKDSAKKIFRISQNATDLLEAVQSLHLATMTEVVNEGILLYLRSLPDSQKQQIGQYLAIKKK